MPSRKPHTKSRHGCNECKQRKVKCDEGQPRCARCTTRRTPCHYSTPFRSDHEIWGSVTRSPESLPGTTTAGSPNHAELPSQAFERIIPPYPSTLSPASISGDVPQQELYQCVDMELLHHWTTSTCNTITRNPALGKMWQTCMPKLAFSAPYLLHSLLAFAANHVIADPPADLSVSLDYCRSRAKYHYASAIALFRPELDDINSHNGTAIFSFSAIFVGLNFSMPQLVDRELVSAELRNKDFIVYMVRLLRLVRGCNVVTIASASYVLDSEFGQLHKVPILGSNEPFSIDVESMYRRIEQRIEHGNEVASHLRTDYLNALKKSRECHPGYGPIVERECILLAWGIVVENSILKEMEMMSPVALAILAFFATLLHTVRTNWWIGDKGMRLVEAITEILPREWEDVIIWARMSVGISTDTTPLQSEMCVRVTSINTSRHPDCHIT